jgi:hypothetical protein
VRRVVARSALLERYLSVSEASPALRALPSRSAVALERLFARLDFCASDPRCALWCVRERVGGCDDDAGMHAARGSTFAKPNQSRSHFLYA